MPIKSRKYNCSPLCEGHIEIYEESEESYNKVIYACSNGETGCPFLSLRMNLDKIVRDLDNLNKTLSKVELNFKVDTGIQIMDAKELELYKKVNNLP